MTDAATTPVLLFGAFDRHNFGDLLFPHIAAALLERRPLLFAGVAQRDLRPYGGHQVHAIAQLMGAWRERPLDILHVGGELLTCDLWQAAVMVQADDQARRVIAALDDKPRERLEWARQSLGLAELAPYVLGREQFPNAARLLFYGVGGVALEGCDPQLRTEVLAKLKMADGVTVRDRVTQAQLEKAGINSSLIPDPAVMVAELFGERIRRCTAEGELAQLFSTFPQGYIAIQFSADFGDDATLTLIAAQLDHLIAVTGCGVVLFRAGAAPWHDDLECYQRLVSKMRSGAVRMFTSLDLWQICAVVAHSQCYCGSSLHGRIVAMAFALPRVNLNHPSHGERITKQRAYAATWEVAGMPAVVEVTEIASGVEQALVVDRLQLQRRADELVELYRQGFAKFWN